MRQAGLRPGRAGRTCSCCSWQSFLGAWALGRPCLHVGVEGGGISSPPSRAGPLQPRARRWAGTSFPAGTAGCGCRNR
ncbi:MAG: SWIM zinc finger family protein [Lysobacter sp.]